MDVSRKKVVKPCILCSGKPFARLDRHLTKVHKLKVGTHDYDNAYRGLTSKDAAEDDQHLKPGCSNTHNAVPTGPETHQNMSSSSPSSSCSSTDEDTDTGTIVSAYHAYLVIPQASKRQMENVKSTVNRIIDFMGQIKNFEEPEAVQSWYSDLSTRGLKASTLKSYLCDVTAFVKWVKDYKPTGLAVSKKVLRPMLMKLSKLSRDNRVNVRRHRLTITHSQQTGLLRSEEIRAIGTDLDRCIPELLLALERAATHRNANRAAAAIILQVTIFNGARRGVFLEMTRDNFASAERLEDMFLVSVPEHKTAQYHGPAVLALTGEEHGWLSRFVEASTKLPGYPRNTDQRLFFSRSGSCMNGLSTNVRKLMHSLGHQGITLHHLRHSISTLNWTHMSGSERNLIAHHMCHSAVTEERFYVRIGTPLGHVQARKNIAALLCGPNV